MKASLSLFAEQGFERTTSSNIAIRAGVSEGTVFKQFKTKHGILKALLQPFIDHVIPRVFNEFTTEVEMSRFTNFEQFLSYMIKDRMTFALENQKQLKVFLQEIVRNPEISKMISVKWNQAMSEKIEYMIDNFKKQKQIVDWPVKRIMQYVISVVLGYLLPRVISNTMASFNLEQKSQEATAFLLRGLSLEK
ncbi:transcriptional regulator [Liquorilactobacillus capillatus DSM 19910]|uniref:Transcriptional regulator n=1 Tax=Liquorilactobacillus capillatus DSM 19910 TaxID=1423731 RepID=A0A0R1M031_9LACO|nr:transcriptional regulator [Liquorilactobacillus capillatus DSM 19910]